MQRVDQWCQEFEQRVRALGGIGFFLGGIGPDGHIGDPTKASADVGKVSFEDGVRFVCDQLREIATFDYPDAP